MTAASTGRRRIVARLLRSSVAGAAFAVLAFVLVADLLRWHRGATHFPVLAQLLLLLAAMTVLAGLAAVLVKVVRERV